MNLLDALTLQAFSLARLHLNAALPKDLTNTICQMGWAIAHHQPNVAPQIREFVKQHGCLRAPYEAAFENLEQHYQIQEQARAQLVSEQSTNLWQQVVADILTAEDPKAVVKQEVLKNGKPPDDFTQLPIPQPYLTALQKEVASLDQQAINILSVLERQLLTVEDLSYGVNLPLDQTKAIVQDLWEKGYIAETKRTPMHRLLSFLGQEQEPREVSDRHSFNLTAKGHFYLHPLVKQR